MLKKAEYGLADVISGQKVFRALLSFRCPTQKDIGIANNFNEIFSDYSKPTLQNIFVLKQNGDRMWIQNQDNKCEIELGHLNSSKQ